MYSFSILSYTHNSLRVFCSSIYVLPSSHTQLQIFLYILRNTLLNKCKYNLLPYPRGMWVNTSEFAGKDKIEIVTSRYSFLTFFMQLWIYTWSFIFLGRFLTLYIWTYYTAITWERPSSGFDITVFLIYIVHAFYGFLKDANKKSLKHLNVRTP